MLLWTPSPNFSMPWEPTGLRPESPADSHSTIHGTKLEHSRDNVTFIDMHLLADELNNSHIVRLFLYMSLYP